MTFSYKEDRGSDIESEASEMKILDHPSNFCIAYFGGILVNALSHHPHRKRLAEICPVTFR